MKLPIFSIINVIVVASSQVSRPQFSVHEGEPYNFCFDKTWSTKNAFRTCVEMTIVQNGLKLSIEAKNDTIQENAYVQCNDDLYNQEVVEVFIANSTNIPEKYVLFSLSLSSSHAIHTNNRYWEVEVSPRGSVWLGYDSNPGGDRHNLSHVYYPCEMVEANVSNFASFWRADLLITKDMLGEGVSDCGKNCRHYTANFFRVQMIPSIWTPYIGHVTRDMVCSPENCSFSCANRPNTPAPDFHQTKYFGDLYLHYNTVVS